MGKFDWRELPRRERLKVLRQLAALLDKVPDIQAMEKVLQNLLTPSEVIMIGRRILIAEELLNGKTYREIQNKLKVGLATVITVEKWLQHTRQQLSTEPTRKQYHQGKKRYRDGVVVGSPEHGMRMLGSHLGLLGFFLGG